MFSISLSLDTNFSLIVLLSIAKSNIFPRYVKDLFFSTAGIIKLLMVTFGKNSWYTPAYFRIPNVTHLSTLI